MIKQIVILNLLIITYQEKLGNYNSLSDIFVLPPIITYQEKLGNYNINA